MVGSWRDIPPPPKKARAAKDESILAQILDEQRKTNSLLLALVDAMADERDPDAEPQTYLSGKVIR
jgi:hypothetical protein